MWVDAFTQISNYCIALEKEENKNQSNQWRLGSLKEIIAKAIGLFLAVVLLEEWFLCLKNHTKSYWK